MSRDVITLQPEVEEILREVAKRPGSGLLRVPRKDVARTVLERDTVVHARAAGLSSAERHLVQVYREEVAFALRQAAYARLTTEASMRGFVADRAFTPLSAAIPSVGTVRASASGALALSCEFDAGNDVISILERCVSPNIHGWPTTGQIAGAAHRLVPAHSSRIYMSLDLRGTGQSRAALLALESVLSGESPSHHLAVAWTNAGDLFFALGQYRDAWDAADRACKVDERWLVAQGNRALCALVVGETARVRSSLEQFERALVDSPSAVTEFSAWYSNHELLPTPAHRGALSQALATVKADLQPLAMEVIRALTR